MKRSCLIKSIACFVGLLLLFNGSSANETKVVNHSMDYANQELILQSLKRKIRDTLSNMDLI